MTSRHKRWQWLAAAAIAALALTAFVAAACGDDDDDGDGGTATAVRTQAAASPTSRAATSAAGSPTAVSGDATPGAADGAGATIATAEDATLGTILVDADGFTLYTFSNDTAGSGASACSGGCATNWPPLTADGEPSAASGINGELATIDRADGTTQVTYNGMPLYRFANDAAPGDTNGHEVGGVWFVAMP
jgi:predicted lipoprotein with Yx(FWY)xxD motif